MGVPNSFPHDMLKGTHLVRREPRIAVPQVEDGACAPGQRVHRVRQHHEEGQRTLPGGLRLKHDPYRQADGQR